VDVEFIPVGGAALLVRLGETIELAVNRRVHALARPGAAITSGSQTVYVQMETLCIHGDSRYADRWDELADEFYLFL
jgi:hypothetical protein